MSEELDSYYQLGNSNPTDSYVPGESKQRVDLTEYYKDSDQDAATVMVMGGEELSLGKLSKKTAIKLGLKNTSQYDPFPSERNARMGAEGFFTTVYDGFKAFIEAIIKYIRMAIDWVVDLVKGIFGFRKSARITKAIDDSLVAMKQEFVNRLNALGFPGADYSVENFIGKLPPGQDRIAQMHVLKSKFTSDTDAIKKLTEALPLLQQCIGKLSQAGDKVGNASKNLKRIILDEYNRTRVRHSQGAQVSAVESSEYMRVSKAIAETSLSLNAQEASNVILSLFKTLFNIDFTNEELATGFSEVQRKLQETVQLEAIKLTSINVDKTMLEIQELNVRYQALADSEIDISKVNWKALGEIIDKSDSEKVTTISIYYNNPGLITVYQQLAVAIRNFTNFCFLVTKELLRVNKQVTDLIEWFNRTHVYYYAAVMEDLDTLQKIVDECRTRGMMVPGAAHTVFIPDADAKTFMEKASANVNFVVKEDMAGTKTIINNFSKQIGWGKRI